MAETVYVNNDDPDYFFIFYLDNGDPTRHTALQAGWQFFDRLDPVTRNTYKIWLRPSNPVIGLMVDHVMPPTTPPGHYRVETFVPAKHATSQKVIFTIGQGVHPTEQGETQLDEALAIVDMNALYDVWYSLGEFYLDPQRHPYIGRVRQYDLSREDPPTEISFGPVRWVPLSVLPGNGLRFDSPVGTPEERDGPTPTGRMMFIRYPVWDGDWFDVNPFLTWYSYGYHTGADLNLPGVSSADRGKPIYAIGDGLVTYAGKAGTWGNIIVIEHPEALVSRPDGQLEQQMVYSRYGHVDDNILVRAGQTVSRGQEIGYIGLAAGAKSGWHLHFDVSYTDILKKRPAHWPDLTALHYGRGDSRAMQGAQASIMRQVISNYLDPLRFIKDNHGNPVK